MKERKKTEDTSPPEVLDMGMLTEKGKHGVLIKDEQPEPLCTPTPN